MRFFVTFLIFSTLGCAGTKKDASAAPSSATATMAAAPATPPPPPAKLTCSKGKVSRVLEVVKTHGGCAFNYTKDGKTESVATSPYGRHHCVHSQEKLRDKLIKAGFICS
jgi:hypothetical protein